MLNNNRQNNQKTNYFEQETWTHQSKQNIGHTQTPNGTNRSPPVTDSGNTKVTTRSMMKQYFNDAALRYIDRSQATTKRNLLDRLYYFAPRPIPIGK